MLSNEKTKSVYGPLKKIAVFGLLTGDFPVKNTIFARHSEGLQYKKLSYPFAWSCILFVSKVSIIGYTVFSMAFLIVFTRTKVGFAMVVPLLLVFICTFLFCLVAHLLNQFRMGKLIRLLQHVDDFDTKYPESWGETCLFSRGALANVIACSLIVASPAVIVYQTLTRLSASIMQQMDYIIFMSEHWNTCLTCLIGMIIVEFGVVFHCTSLFYISHVVIHRLGNLWQTYSENQLTSAWNLDDVPVGGRSKLMPADKKAHLFGIGNHNRKPLWNRASEKYLDFKEVFEEYENYIGLSFIVLYLSLTVSLICTIFIVFSGSAPPVLQDCSVELLGIVLFNFFQVYFLADIGEKVNAAYTKLVKTTSRLSSTASQFSHAEKSQSCLYMNWVHIKVQSIIVPSHTAAKLTKKMIKVDDELKQLLAIVMANPVILSAKGFFTVTRSNVTSILSVTLTYLVVLSQYVDSEPSKVEKSLQSNVTNDLTLEQ